MKFTNYSSLLFLISMVFASCRSDPEKKPSIEQGIKSANYTEKYRPQFHFSPEKMWMNDPNGMVYNEGIYHLFYQYYPEDIVWGPMHWGHAVSKDLWHWEHKPIALYPDEHGYIFSGSAVLDKNNTSGFGTSENPPLVAIFTYHDAEAEGEGRTDYQTQGIAFSLDNGQTWEKYSGNPVIGNTNEKDFRDPKVMWHERSKQWIMTLVAGDHAQFYGSVDLKNWKLLSEFGKAKGAHGGVWECPDLIELNVEGTAERKWVLLISINPGAPNGGSGTQYFIGNFDGTSFRTDQKETLWLDWGTDNYAGVTWSNHPDGKTIFIGWMSNWMYANQTPTTKWRSAMTVPRRLSLRKIDGHYRLLNYPISNFKDLTQSVTESEIDLEAGAHKIFENEDLNQSEIRFETSSRSFGLTLSNNGKEAVKLTMSAQKEEFYLDRSASGQIDFQENFGGVQKMPLPNLPKGTYEVRMLIDRSSIEIFINGGEYVMTAQLFPEEPYSDLTIENLGEETLRFKNFEIRRVNGVW